MVIAARRVVKSRSPKGGLLGNKQRTSGDPCFGSYGQCGLRKGDRLGSGSPRHFSVTHPRWRMDRVCLHMDNLVCHFLRGLLRNLGLL